MSTQGVKLKAIADAIREKDGTAASIPANTFADRILALPVGVQNPSVTLPAASTQEEQFARIAEAIRAKEGSVGTIAASEFASRIAELKKQTPSRLPEGYTEVEYIHLSGAVGFQTNYCATPSVVRVLFDMQMEAYSGNTERLFYQYGTSGASTVDYYFTLSRYSESQFRIMPGTLSGKYNTLSTGSVTGERITIDANIPLKKVTIGSFSATIMSGITSAFNQRYLYIFGGSSAQYAPTSNLYSCKVYVRESLKFDFVPCTDSSGVAGLFDLVGSKFYANSFSGTVTAGPAV